MPEKIEFLTHPNAASDAAYTLITKDENGEIVRLDTHIPEVLENTHYIAVAFAALQRHHAEAKVGKVNLRVNRADARSTIRGIETSGALGLRGRITLPADVFGADDAGIKLYSNVGAVRAGATFIGVDTRA